MVTMQLFTIQFFQLFYMFGNFHNKNLRGRKHFMYMSTQTCIYSKMFKVVTFQWWQYGCFLNPVLYIYICHRHHTALVPPRVPGWGWPAGTASVTSLYLQGKVSTQLSQVCHMLPEARASVQLCTEPLQDLCTNHSPNTLQLWDPQVVTSSLCALVS